MRFHLAFFSSFLFASTALADRRRETNRRSQFHNRAKRATNDATDIDYNTIWAGAVWDVDVGAFTSITGTFTIPVTSGKSGAGASPWVGIDGGACMGDGLLQTGVDFIMNDTGPTYNAWYEWYPADSYYFSNLPISAGDRIKVNVTALSATSGIATVENLSNGHSGSKELHSTHPLCQKKAQWIVEDFSYDNDTLVPFANFGTVTFTDAVATGPSGSYTPHGAMLVSIQQNNKTLTSVATNGSALTIKYV